jgi:hypothetical protein
VQIVRDVSSLFYARDGFELSDGILITPFEFPAILIVKLVAQKVGIGDHPFRDIAPGSDDCGRD